MALGRAGWRAASGAFAGLPASRRRLDLTAVTIDLADRIEAGFLILKRFVLLAFPKRGLGLPAALVWRGFAALAGIGVAGALVTGLSAPGDATALTNAPLRPEEARPAPASASRDIAPMADDADWVALSKPIPLFGLPAPDLARDPASYEARRSRDGSRREDVLAFGSFAGDQPYLVLRLRSGARSEGLSRPFLISLVREAAGHALAVRRTSTPAPLRTRFGEIATVDALLDDGTSERACLALRMEAGEMPFALSGWWCAGGKATDRRQLACLIERLDLVNAGDDRELRMAFSRTELDRQSFCAPRRLSAAGRKTSWLDADGVAPALRLKPAATEPPAASRPKPKRARQKQARTAGMAQTR